MLPIRDHNRPETTPWVNYTIIAVNIVVFLLQFGDPNFENIVLHWGFIPHVFSLSPQTEYVKVLTSMFMHGGILHLVSNMWFLHIFGDNVEDAFGHLKYLGFYVLCGAAAIALQYFFSADSVIPLIGASGAISGVAGAYFVLFRHSKILTLVPLLGFVTFMDLPSSLFLGYWFVIQLFHGAGSLLTYDINQGGVAWFAHVGGFLAGYLLAQFVKNVERPTNIEP